MARAKHEDPPKGAPAWQSTFSDLMNLLLCFFVLLFSMSTISEDKLEQVVQSFQNTFSILPAGGASIGQQGNLISSGVSALEMFDVYFNESNGRSGDEKNEGNDADSDQDKTGDEGQKNGIDDGGSGSKEQSAEEVKEQYEKQELAESEEMSEKIEEQLKQYGIQDQAELNFNGQYVRITLNGAMLFDSGRAEVKKDAEPLLDKLTAILSTYGGNMIEIEGHTDSVPIRNSQYESNDVLSMYRALYVADYIRAHSSIDPGHIVSAGRGEYSPIADNSTPEGRAMNRRVEIKIYNSYNSSEVTGNGTD